MRRRRRGKKMRRGRFKARRVKKRRGRAGRLRIGYRM